MSDETPYMPQSAPSPAAATADTQFSQNCDQVSSLGNLVIAPQPHNRICVAIRHAVNIKREWENRWPIRLNDGVGLITFRVEFSFSQALVKFGQQGWVVFNFGSERFMKRIDVYIVRLAGQIVLPLSWNGQAH